MLTWKRRLGEKVSYGDEIMLSHYDSQFLLEGSKTCSEFDKACNMLQLSKMGSKSVYFIIEPKYKYRSEGQPVTYGDVCKFKNTKTKYYMHISEHETLMPNQELSDDTIRKNDDLRSPRINTDFLNIVPTATENKTLH